MSNRATVVVTGAAAGIGRAIAERVARDGARVIAVDRSASVAEVATGLGRDHVAIHGDVDQVSTHERAAAAAGVARAWINCAGLTAVMDLATLKPDAARRLVDVNLLGTLWGTSVALRTLERHGRGAIVNVSSVHASRAYPGYGVYELTKAGVDAITRSAAVEGASNGIRVNSVAPGAIATESLQDSLASSSDPVGARRSLEARSPLARLGEPSEIAAVVAFLISEDASYLTGQVLIVDGGWSAMLGRDDNPSQYRKVGGTE